MKNGTKSGPIITVGFYERVKIMKIGTTIKASGRLVRKRNGCDRFWENDNVPFTGYYVGTRTYANGYVIEDIEEGTEFECESHFTVLLLVTHERRHPVPVLASEAIDLSAALP